jgi:hypothetical protein
MRINMRPLRAWLALASVFAASYACAHAALQTQQPFIIQDFEKGDTGSWQIMGTGGKVTVTTAPTDVKSGKYALQLDYNVAKGEGSFLIHPLQAGDLTKARSIRLWVKADYAAPLAIALQERDNNGRYIAMFTAPAGKWQQVELAPGDFTLSDGNDDPKDPNNKLDLEQVEAVVIADIAQMFAQGDQALSGLFGIKLGPHKLYVDDISVSAEPLPAQPEGPANEFRIEPMLRPQLSWFGAGGVSLSTTSDKPLDGKSLQVTYRSAPMKVTGFGRRFTVGKLAAMDRIVFMVAADKPAKVLVQVEERGGGKYNAIVEVPGGKMPKEISVRFSEMNESDDSKDANRKLDVDQLGQVFFMDMTGWLDMTEQDNVLWIGGLKAAK